MHKTRFQQKKRTQILSRVGKKQKHQKAQSLQTQSSTGKSAHRRTSPSQEPRTKDPDRDKCHRQLLKVACQRKLTPKIQLDWRSGEWLNAKRTEFLKLVAKAEPNVLEDLRGKPLKLYRASKARPNAAGLLDQALKYWARKYNLEADWILKRARETLQEWDSKAKQHLKQLKPLFWSSANYGGDAPGVVELDEDFTPIEYPCSLQDYLDEVESDALRVFDETILKHTRLLSQEKCLKDLRVQAKRYWTQSTKAARRHSEVRVVTNEPTVMRNLAWAVLYQVGEREWWEIAALHRNVMHESMESDTVRKAGERELKDLGIKPRPAKRMGRPPER